MKRFCILLVVIFLVSAFGGIAEEGDNGIDFASMSIEELFQVIEDANNELALRGQWTMLFEGSYLVGTDIPAGKYEISEHHAKGYEDGYWSIKFRDKYGSFLDIVVFKSGMKAVVDFSEDTIIEISGSSPEKKSVLTIKDFTPIVIK